MPLPIYIYFKLSKMGVSYLESFNLLTILVLWYQRWFVFFFNLFYFIYLFLAALGLRCCTRDFSSCGEWGLLFVAVHGLLIAVASLLLWSTGSRCAGFSSCGSRALLLRGMRDLPRPGLKPVSPAVAGGFFFFFFFKKFTFFYLFIYDCVESLFLCEGFL